MNEPRTLRDVAQAVVDANNGASGRQIDALAKRRGLVLSYTTFNGIMLGTYNARPTVKTLDALAELSGLSRESVYEAAGVNMPAAPLAQQLPPEADQLLPHQRQAIIDMTRAFVRDNKIMTELKQGNAHVQAAEVEEVQGYMPGSSSPQKSGVTRRDVIERPWERLSGAERDAAIDDLIANGYADYELVAANPDDQDDTDAFEGA